MPGHEVRVVPGDAEHVHVAVAELIGVLAKELVEPLVEDRAAPGPGVEDLALARRPRRGDRDRPAHPLGHHPFGRGVFVADIDDTASPVGDDARLVGPRKQMGRGAPAAVGVVPADLIDGIQEPTAGQQRVLSLLHRPRASVSGLALELDQDAGRVHRPGDHTDQDLLLVEDRPLFDVELEVAIDRPPADGGRTIVTDPLQLLAQDRPVVAGAVEYPVHLVDPSEGARRNHGGGEPAALLVRPIDDLDRPAGRVFEVVERPHQLKAHEHAEDAVEPPAVELRVEVAANHDRRQAVFLPGPSAEDAPDLVHRDRQAGLLAPLDEQIPHLLVGIGQGQTSQAARPPLADLRRLVDGGPEPAAVDACGVGESHRSVS